MPTLPGYTPADQVTPTGTQLKTSNPAAYFNPVAASVPLQGGVSAYAPAAGADAAQAAMWAAQFAASQTPLQGGVQQQSVQLNPQITATGGGGGGGGGGGEGGRSSSNAVANNNLVFPSNFIPPEFQLAQAPNINLPGFGQLPGFSNPNLIQPQGAPSFQMPQIQPQSGFGSAGGMVAQGAQAPAAWDVKQGGQPIAAGVQKTTKAEPEGRKNAQPAQQPVINNMPPLPPFGGGVFQGDVAGTGSAGGAEAAAKMPKANPKVSIPDDAWIPKIEPEAKAPLKAQAAKKGPAKKQPQMMIPPPPAELTTINQQGGKSAKERAAELRRQADMLEASEQQPEQKPLPPPHEALAPIPQPKPVPDAKAVADNTAVPANDVFKDMQERIKKKHDEAEQQVASLPFRAQGRYVQQMQAQAHQTYSQMKQVEQMIQQSQMQAMYGADQYANQYVKSTKWTQISNALSGAPVVSNAARYDYARQHYLANAAQQQRGLEAHYRDLREQYSSELTAANNGAKELDEQAKQIRTDAHNELMEEINTIKGGSANDIAIARLYETANNHMMNHEDKAKEIASKENIAEENNDTKLKTTDMNNRSREGIAAAGNETKLKTTDMNNRSRETVAEAGNESHEKIAAAGNETKLKTTDLNNKSHEKIAAENNQNKLRTTAMNIEARKALADDKNALEERKAKLAERAQTFKENTSVAGMVGNAVSGAGKLVGNGFGVVGNFAQNWAKSDANKRKEDAKRIVDLARESREIANQDYKVRQAERAEQNKELERLYKEKVLSQKAYETEIRARKDADLLEFRKREMLDKELGGTVDKLQKGLVYGPTAFEKVVKTINDHPYIFGGLAGGGFVGTVKALKGAP